MSAETARPKGLSLRPRRVGLNRRHVLMFPALVWVGGCSLPHQGPASTTVVSGAKNLDYVLIDVDADVARLAGIPPRQQLSELPAPTVEPSQAVGIGDVLQIRILEAGAGGLFATGDGGAGGTDFPHVVVDRDGNINLPYVGSIKVIGEPPARIQEMIVERLTGKAIEPQALVNISRAENNIATIAGDVARPGPFPLSLRGDTLSQAISAAGGSRFPAHESRVTVARNGRTRSAYLNDVLLNPANDIRVQRDDLIVITREPPRYTITGSVGRPGTFDLANSDYSMLEAVSAAGGPVDNRADPGGVFLFRYETHRRLTSLGKTGLDAYPMSDLGIPAVYRFDFGNPETQFLARSFLLADGDAIYVANAESIQFTKLLTLFDLSLTTGNRIQTLQDR